MNDTLSTPARVAASIALSLVPAGIAYFVFSRLHRDNPEDVLWSVIAFALAFPAVFAAGFIINLAIRVPYQQWSQMEAQRDGLLDELVNNLSAKADMTFSEALAYLAYRSDWALQQGEAVTWDAVRQQFCQTMFDYEAGALGVWQKNEANRENASRSIDREFWQRARFDPLLTIVHRSNTASDHEGRYWDIRICSAILRRQWGYIKAGQSAHQPLPLEAQVIVSRHNHDEYLERRSRELNDDPKQNE